MGRYTNQTTSPSPGLLWNANWKGPGFPDPVGIREMHLCLGKTRYGRILSMGGSETGCVFTPLPSQSSVFHLPSSTILSPILSLSHEPDSRASLLSLSHEPDSRASLLSLSYEPVSRFAPESPFPNLANSLHVAYSLPHSTPRNVWPSRRPSLFIKECNFVCHRHGTQFAS